jgi:chromosome partitioning protein
MIVTVGNTKGGVGKTTLAINLAVAQALRGRDVWLIDADRQGSAQSAIAMRAEAGTQPGIACAQYAQGSTLRAQIKQQAAKFEDIIIDVGGHDSSAFRAALLLADVLVVPFQPRSYDVWALADVAELVEEVRSLRDGLRVLAVLNLADAVHQGADNQQAAQAVSEWPFTLIDAPIRRRKAFANAAGFGQSVLETTPRDAKACAELNAVLSHVFA